MIPKILYFIWFGERKPVTLNYVMQTYKKVNRDFIIKSFFEKDVLLSGNSDIIKCLEKSRTPGSKYYEIFKSYGGRDFNKAFAKVFACYMLDMYGGVYVDCDTFPTKRFDNGILSKKYFQCQVTWGDQSNCRICSYLMGAEAGQDVYPYGRVFSNSSPYLLQADSLTENVKTRQYMQKKFEQCQLYFGQTYEQFPTQYVSHYRQPCGKQDPRARQNCSCMQVPSAAGKGKEPYGQDEQFLPDYWKENTVDRMSVVFITHNRTNVAKYTLRNLVRHLRFDGVIKWIIADDMSEDGHVHELELVMAECGVSDFDVTHTNSDNRGLGSSMNNGLSAAFSFSPVVLTSEDDFALEKDLDVTNWVNYLDQSCHAIIRLAYKEKKLRKAKATKDLDFIFGNPGNPWLFNNQVAIRHKRIYDAIGMYPENANPDKTEVSLRNAYNRLTNYGQDRAFRILVPSCIKESTFDHDSLIFTHIGKSTCQHDNYHVPERYKFVYEEPETNFYRITPEQLLQNSFVISIDAIRLQRFQRIFGKSGLSMPRPFEGFSNPDIESGPYKCELSHAAVVKAAKALDLPFVCIFEDDAYPAKGVCGILADQLKRIPRYAKIILLGWLDSFCETTRDGEFRGVGYAYGSHAYIVTKDGYDEYLASYSKKPDLVADQFECFVSKDSVIRIGQNAFIQYSEGSMHGFSGYAVGKNINKNCLKRPPEGFPDISMFDDSSERENV